MDETKSEFLGSSPPECECCKEHSHLPSHPATWHLEHVGRSLPHFAHTHAQYAHPVDSLNVHWNSRNHRKSRAPVVRSATGKRLPLHRPPIVLLNLDVFNISWWLGAVFTVASAVWVVNGVYAFAPGLAPDSRTGDMIEGITALIGGSMFIVGGYLAILEVLNAKPEVDLGCLLESQGKTGDSAWTGMAVPTRRRQTQASGREARPRWRWWGWQPSSVGYMASLLVFIGAIIFYIPCITGFWVIFDDLSVAAQNVLFWLPQVVASCFFVLSPALQMLEVQRKWYLIRPLNLGWQAAFWNFIGGWGFLLCGAFGFAVGNEEIETWGVTFSTLWGSVAFLIGSMVQWFECMNPHAIII